MNCLHSLRLFSVFFQIFSQRSPLNIEHVPQSWQQLIPYCRWSWNPNNTLYSTIPIKKNTNKPLFHSVHTILRWFLTVECVEKFIIKYNCVLLGVWWLVRMDRVVNLRTSGNIYDSEQHNTSAQILHPIAKWNLIHSHEWDEWMNAKQKEATAFNFISTI